MFKDNLKSRKLLRCANCRWWKRIVISGECTHPDHGGDLTLAIDQCTDFGIKKADD